MTQEEKDLEQLGAKELQGEVHSKEDERMDLNLEEAIAKTRAEKKKRLAQVLSRGRVNTKVEEILKRATPQGRVGKLVRDTPSDIAAYMNLGYTFDTRDVEGMHGTGDGRIRVGDCVLMTALKEDVEILREIRTDRVLENVDGAAQEEFAQQIGAGVVDESRTQIRSGR